MRLEMTWDPDDARLVADLERVDRLVYSCRTLLPPGDIESLRELARHRSARSLVTDALGPTGKDQQRANVQEARALFYVIAGDSSLRIETGLIRAMNAVLSRGLRARARAGQFRTDARVITDAPTRRMRYRPARPEHVPSLMDHLARDLQDWIDDGVPGPVVSALAHLALMVIHPFDRANYTTAQLLADVILEQTRMSVEGMLSLGDVLSGSWRDHPREIRALYGEEFRPQLNVDAWLRWYVEGLLTAARRLEQKLVSHNQRIDEYRRTYGEALNERQVLGVLFADEIEPVSSSRYASLTGCSQSSAKADLNALVRAGVLERVGNGRLTRYRVTDEWASSATPNRTASPPDAGRAEDEPARNAPGGSSTNVLASAGSASRPARG